GAMLQTALDLKGKVNVGRVDAYVNTKLGTRFGVTGYPWLVLLHQGRLYEFDGIRDPKLMTAFALEDFATKESREIPSPLGEEVDSSLESSEIPLNVIKLTTPDLKKLDKAFVMIHAPWCGHCNKLLPTFGKAATQLLGQVTFGSIDGTDPDNKPIMTAFDIKSYPTILMLHDNSYTPYEGDRALNSLVSFASSGYLDAKDNTQPMPTITAISSTASKGTKNEDTVEMAKNVHVVEWTTDMFDTAMQTPAKSSSELFLVEFYAQWCGPCRAFSSLYEEIAGELKKSSDIVVARIDGALEEELRTRMNILNYPTILLVDKTNGQMYKFSSKERTKEAIMAFVNNGYKEVKGSPVPPPTSSTLSIILAAIIIGGIGWSIGHFKNGKKKSKSVPKKPKKKIA
ncbi:thioredoxin domain containing 5-like, partial [Thraustotheca clavata]